MPIIVKSSIEDNRYPNGIQVPLHIARKSILIKELLEEGPEALEILEGYGSITVGDIPYDSIGLLFDYLINYEDQKLTPGVIHAWEKEYFKEVPTEIFMNFVILAVSIQVPSAANFIKIYMGPVVNLILR
jgi:hypothetical protein